MKNIPVIILCGGLGSRLSEETHLLPKPLIKIGKYPIIYNIIKIYLRYGVKNFILPTGYKHKEFLKFFTSELPKKINKKMTIIKNARSILIDYKSFTVEIVFTGIKTKTGSRIFKCKKNILSKNTKYFMVTYGDGLLNTNIKKTYNLLLKNKKMVGIMTVVNPEERFGTLTIKNNKVENFKEKIKDPNKWINAGFFIFRDTLFKYLDKNSMLEEGPLKKLTKSKKMLAYKHKKFYHFIDTLKEKKIAINLIKNNKVAPWLH